MEYKDFVEYYSNKHETKIFLTRLNLGDEDAKIMYIYQYQEELKNFCETFLYYLPFYVRNTDQLCSISEESIDFDLVEKSKRIRLNDRIVPQRDPENDGIYGELFLDFYLRIVGKKKCLITYASRRPFDSNSESKGIDNVVYYVENGTVNVCFCEAKFVSSSSVAKNNLLNDIMGNGTTNQPGHLTKEFINRYIGFIADKTTDIDDTDKILLKDLIDDLNNCLDNEENFLDVLIRRNVCFNFIFFAIFNSAARTPEDLEDNYTQIVETSKQRITEMGISNYLIEVVFIPTENTSMTIKKEIEKNYE